MKKDKRTPLEVQRDRLLEQLANARTNSSEYEIVSKELEKIYEIMEKEKKSKNRISPDTLALIAANLLGIGLTAGFEYLHVLPNKAFNLIKRLF